jgi:hypothetical protein
MSNSQQVPEPPQTSTRKDLRDLVAFLAEQVVKGLPIECQVKKRQREGTKQGK